MARGLRFKKRVSDRSGFDYLESEMVKEDGSWIHSSEVDASPPSKLSLGGEGEITRGRYFRSATNITVTDSGYDNPVQYITAAAGITPSFVHPYMRVVGSNANINLTADPQVGIATEGKVLTLYGVGSTITLENGTGLATTGSAPFVLGSGNSITFIYNSGNTAWNETSRYSGEGFG